MNFGSCIPQIFYDLIGRIAPGTVIILATLIVFDILIIDSCTNELILKLPTASKTFFFIIGLILSYFLGMCFNGIGYLFEDKLWRKTKTIEDNKDRELSKKNELKNHTPNKYDSIHLYLPRIGARLAKLSAEIGFCRVVINGFLFLIFVNFIRNFTDLANFRFLQTEAILFLCILAAFYQKKHLHFRLRESLQNHWELLSEVKKDFKRKIKEIAKEGLIE